MEETWASLGNSEWDFTVSILLQIRSGLHRRTIWTINIFGKLEDKFRIFVPKRDAFKWVLSSTFESSYLNILLILRTMTAMYYDSPSPTFN